MSAKSSTAPVHRVHFLKTAWFRVAAVLLLIAGTATLLYLNNRPQQDIVTKQPTTITPDIQPGGNKAILTLSDGSTIILDSAANGALAQEGNTKIVKLATGALAYEGKGMAGEVLYNTITTPKGGLYQVGLPDGSKVWLNAASSVRFPAAFGKERTVTVTGEVYFEIAADKTKPFYVSTGNTQVQVLGTSFNINSYTDEASIHTTLLSGSVKVVEGQGNVLLQPGQMARTGASKPIEIMKGVNVNRVMAWKNGFFNFDGMNVTALMRQVARWYDITVIYEGTVPGEVFAGELPQDLPLSSLLKALESFGVHSKLDLNKRIVTIHP